MHKFVNKSPDSTARETAFRIVLPLILLITIVIVVILSLVFYSTQKANLDTKIAAENSVRSILKDRQSQLATLTKDYSYWDDTILNAFYAQNLEWINGNLGSYLTNTFGISELLILDSKNKSILSLQEGLPADWTDTKKITGGLEELIIRARESGPTPIPVSGILLIDGLPALVSASVLTPEWEDSKQVPTPRPVLVLAKRFDENRLAEISKSFGLDDFRFQRGELPLSLPDLSYLEVRTLDDSFLGNLIWVPEQPGTSVLHYIKKPLAISLFLVLIFGSWIARVSMLTARRLSEAHHMTSKLTCAIEQTNSAVLIANRSGTVEYANSEFLRMFWHHSGEEGNLKLSELLPTERYPRLGRAFMSAFNEQSNWAGEVEHQAMDGSKSWIHATVTPIKNKNKYTDVVCVATDVTHMKEAFDEMAHLASHDVLTGLINRRLFNELFEQAAQLAKRDSSRAAVLYIDLDGFKEVNDTLGHAVGDQLLIKIAERLKDSVRESDVVARLGGDEFIVLLHNTDNRSDVEQSVISILTHLCKPLNISNPPVCISASVGIARIPDDGLEPNELIRKADVALYKIKRRGGNAYSFFSKEMDIHGLSNKG
ncbi:MAG: diguanylate cyclase [Motiliproteus sp.]